MIRLVAESGLAVVAIGDEDQSIYGYRHAAPEGIREFPSDFKIDENDDYRLTISRRCGAEILRAAQTLIEQAPGRPKQAPMTPYDPSKPGVVAYLRFDTMAAEADGVAGIVAARLAAGVPAKQIAVLARSRVDAWVAALKPALEARGINIASSAWVDVALDDLELRRIRALAYLSLNPEDSLAWLTLLHLTPGLGSTALDRIFESTGSGENFSNALRRICNAGSELLTNSQLSKIRETVSLVDGEVESFKIPEGATIQNFGLWLEERAKAPLSPEAKKLVETVGEKSGDVGLGEFLANLEPMGNDFALSEQDAIRFMTMGASKGLTVDTVIVVGVEEGIVPLPPPRGDENEERRLLYVAMTRATDYCILTFSTRRVGNLARVGSENLGGRTRSPLLLGVCEPTAASPWLATQGW